MRLVQTTVGTAILRDLLPDDDCRAPRSALLLRPVQRAIIAGAGGIRRLRWSRGGRGKRGGLRVTYFWFVSEGVAYMRYAYAEGVAADLTPAQITTLRGSVKEEFE